MNQITIPEDEYLLLKKQSEAYKLMVSNLFHSIIKDPVQIVVDDFRKSDLYTDEFINDLEKGLKKSSYGKKSVNI